MSERDSFRAAEAILYDYPFLRARLKNYPIPHADIMTLGQVKEFTSPQERFACKHAETVRLTSAVEGALRAMSRPERQLVRLKYFERWPNRVVARRLHISEPTFYRLRAKLIKEVALALGLEMPNVAGQTGGGVIET